MMSSLWFQSDIYLKATAAVRGSSHSSSKEMSSSSPQAPTAYEIPECPLSSWEGNMVSRLLEALIIIFNKWNQSVKRFCFHGWESGRWKPYPEIWNTWLSFCPIVSLLNAQQHCFEEIMSVGGEELSFTTLMSLWQYGQDYKAKRGIKLWENFQTSHMPFLSFMNS